MGLDQAALLDLNEIDILNCTAIDFETTNSYRASRHAVDLVRVRDVTIRQSIKNRFAHYEVNADAQDENYLARRDKGVYGDYPQTKLNKGCRRHAGQSPVTPRRA